MGRHDALIERATEVARTSQHPKWMLGAVATRDGKILAWAPNKVRNDPWINHHHATRHAEMAAMRQLRGWLSPGLQLIQST